MLGIGVNHNPLRRRQIASQTQGATVVEPVDLQAANALKCLLAFAAKVITRASPATLQPRLESLRRGTARNPTTEAEAALVAFANAPSFPLATEARCAWTGQDNARIYRPDFCIAVCARCKWPLEAIVVLPMPRCGSANEIDMRVAPLRAVQLEVPCC